ncbi:hypothetical protein AAV97_17330 [Acinetobacter sp. Ag2]|uniref:hypothetical protein n=1 Tax=Acinetobacter sp. Ag2 TaxID=1646532 RepID=UPI000629B332|nr:hypothetical protein [Acinetobacter sp. Ag2]KKW76153.1 hypothetical protein AAV97_17330 [Acinetobacter sp. Ag2]
MKRRYIVCFDDLSPDQEKLVTNYMKEKKLAWWHWIGDTWFAVDSLGKYSAAIVRDDLMAIVKERLIVIELNEEKDTWAGVRVKDPEKKMFTWFKNVWKK